MTPAKGREIVIEFEKIQLIRKRARTELRHCAGCGMASDAVSQTEAAQLFETGPARLFQFITQNNCHYDLGHNGITYLCVPSLIERLKAADQTFNKDLKLLGGRK